MQETYIPICLQRMGWRLILKLQTDKRSIEWLDSLFCLLVTSYWQKVVSVSQLKITLVRRSVWSAHIPRFSKEGFSTCWMWLLMATNTGLCACRYIRTRVTDWRGLACISSLCSLTSSKNASKLDAATFRLHCYWRYVVVLLEYTLGSLLLSECG